MIVSEQRLAVLFALGGMVCLLLAAGVSVTDSPTRRSQSVVQRVAFDAVKARATKRAQRLANRLVPTLGQGDSKQLQADIELAAQSSPEIIEIGVADTDATMTLLACSDPSRIGKSLAGLPARIIRQQGPPARDSDGDAPSAEEDRAAQQVAVVVPMGRQQLLARLYVLETTSALEEDLSHGVVIPPARVPVWLTILFGLIGLLTSLFLLWLGARRLEAQAVQVHEMAEHLAAGNFEARLDPQIGDVADRLNTTAEQVQLLQQAQLEGSMHASRINEELHDAQVVQQTLMPDVRRVARGALQLCGVYRSVSRLSGDWWNYYPLDDDRTLLVLADVLGHGIGAAVVGAMAFGCAAQLHQELGSAMRPDILLHRLNRAIFSTTRGQYTMSCFAAILDTKECLLTYASGAHAFPLLFRSRDSQKPFVPLVVPGAPLGSSEAPDFTASTQPFEQGDLLICYTDGLIEAANASGDPFGEKRVRQTVQRSVSRNVEEICEVVLSEVSRFVGSVELDDDQTLVVARNASPSAVSWSSP